MGCENQRYLMHHGIQGQKWGVRRYQNEDGSLKPAGEKRYSSAYYEQLNQYQGKLAKKADKAKHKYDKAESKARQAESEHRKASKVEKARSKATKARKAYEDALAKSLDKKYVESEFKKYQTRQAMIWGSLEAMSAAQKRNSRKQSARLTIASGRVGR